MFNIKRRVIKAFYDNVINYYEGLKKVYYIIKAIILHF